MLKPGGGLRPMVRILAIDGGGVRGLVPAVFLRELEQRTGRATARLFDLMAGTSTGGILTLALNRPGPDGEPLFSASRVMEMYRDRAAEIFPRSAWRKLRTFGGLTDERYSSRGIESVVGEYLGETRLKEAVTPVLVTAYELGNHEPWFFRSERAKADPAWDFAMRAVARATSAAPTYFEPAQIGKARLVDGGVFANNPAMCAVADVLSGQATRPGGISPGGICPGGICVVSLGTGTPVEALSFDGVSGWGMVRWLRPLLDVMFDGASKTADYQVRQVIGNCPSSHYLRWQVPLGRDLEPMDASDAASLAGLQRVAEASVRERSEELDVLCHILTGRREAFINRPGKAA